MNAYHYSILTESKTNDLLILSKERQPNSNNQSCHICKQQLPDSWAGQVSYFLFLSFFPLSSFLSFVVGKDTPVHLINIYEGKKK